jgi:hypothetical protein
MTLDSMLLKVNNTNTLATFLIHYLKKWWIKLANVLFFTLIVKNYFTKHLKTIIFCYYCFFFLIH